MKICSKTHEIATFKKNSRRNSMPLNPPSKRLAIRHASQAASQHATRPGLQKSWAPLANPAYAHGLATTKKFI